VPRCLRHIIALLTLAAYLAGAQGVLPTASLLARWSPLRERFPCEGCACGCLSARDCWTNCCCHSPAERLAWARRNGVTPPAYAVAALAAARESGESCPSCQQTGDEHDSNAALGNRAPSPGATLSDLGCRGVAMWIVFAAPVSIGGDAGELVAPPPRLVRSVAPAAERPASMAIEIPTPPPRSV
jgi:hypothetical protein